MVAVWTHGDYPGGEQVGWCHNCGTWQLKRDSRWLHPSWSDGAGWCCVVCDDEPWGMGVWPRKAVCAECAPVELVMAEEQRVAVGPGMCDQCDQAEEHDAEDE